MKSIILTLLISLLSFSSIAQQQKSITIEKNSQGSFNIYNDSGELIEELAHSETDSATLVAFNKIFDNENFNSNNKVPISVILLPESQNNIMVLIIAIIGILGTFFSGYFIHRWNKKAQIEQFKLQTKIQFNKEQLDLLVTYVADFVSEANTFNMIHELESTSEKMEDLKKYAEYLKMNLKKMKELNIKINCILSKENEKHLNLLVLLNKIEGQSYSKSEEVHLTLTKEILDVQDLISEIYKSELKMFFDSAK